MSQSRLFTPILLAGCVILKLNFGVRASFGMFQIPIASEFGWVRADFSMAIAIQNLAWGIGQPIFGAMARHSAADVWSCRAYLRAALHGNALQSRVFLASIGVVPCGMAGWQNVWYFR